MLPFYPPLGTYAFISESPPVTVDAIIHLTTSDAIKQYRLVLESGGVTATNAPSTNTMWLGTENLDSESQHSGLFNYAMNDAVNARLASIDSPPTVSVSSVDALRQAAAVSSPFCMEVHAQ